MRESRIALRSIRATLASFTASKKSAAIFAPSPLAGEGSSEFQQTRLGEGVSTFESSEEAPHPIETAAPPAQPSPATEIGYIRFRSLYGAAEVGNIRLRLGEGADTSTAFMTQRVAHMERSGMRESRIALRSIRATLAIHRSKCRSL
jgi:hypothetical protein